MTNKILFNKVCILLLSIVIFTFFVISYTKVRKEIVIIIYIFLIIIIIKLTDNTTLKNYENEINLDINIRKCNVCNNSLKYCKKCNGIRKGLIEGFGCGACKKHSCCSCKCMASGPCATVDELHNYNKSTGIVRWHRREKDGRDPHGAFYSNCRRRGCISACGGGVLGWHQSPFKVNCEGNYKPWVPDYLEGTESREFDIQFYPKHGGSDCPPLKEKRKLKVDCMLIGAPNPVLVDRHGWTYWTECNPNTGTKTRNPLVQFHPKNGGKACPGPETAPCPVDCVYTWGNWSACDKKTGTQYRDPVASITAKNGGKACPARQTQNCKIDCEVNWGNWSACDKKTGTRFRDPTVSIQPKNGGKACETRQTENCKIDCESDWKEYGTCEKDTGTQTRDPNVLVTPKNGGKACPPQETRNCKVDCELSDWRNFGKCSKDCGKGEQEQIKNILVHAKNGGVACPLPNQRKRKVPCEGTDCSKYCPPKSNPPDCPPGTKGCRANPGLCYDNQSKKMVSTYFIPDKDFCPENESGGPNVPVNYGNQRVWDRSGDS